MRTLNRTLIILLIITLLSLAGWGLYQLGRDKGESNIKSQIIENYILIEKIAELASLEVSGTSEIKVSNAETESWYSGLQNALLENTYLAKIPFSAKYGINLKNIKITVAREEKIVKLYLPSPTLLSYEMRIDKMETFDKKGLLVGASSRFNETYQKKLYTNSRKRMETNATYLQQSKDEVARLMLDYLKLSRAEIEIYFDQKRWVKSGTPKNKS